MSGRLLHILSCFLTLMLSASLCPADDVASGPELESKAATNIPIDVAQPALSTQEPLPAIEELSSVVPLPLVDSVIAEPLPDTEQLPLGPAPSAQPAAAQLNSTGSGSWVMQTALALGVVIGLILLLRIGLKRLGAQSGFGSARGLVEVLARSTIGPKTQVVFLKINQRVIVAGQTPAGINTLATLDDPDEVAAVLARIHSSRPASISQGFARLVGQLDKSYERTDRETGSDSDEHVVDRARDQVSGLLNRIRDQQRSDDQTQ